MEYINFGNDPQSIEDHLNFNILKKHLVKVRYELESLASSSKELVAGSVSQPMVRTPNKDIIIEVIDIDPNVSKNDFEFRELGPIIHGEIDGLLRKANNTKINTIKIVRDEKFENPIGMLNVEPANLIGSANKLELYAEYKEHILYKYVVDGDRNFIKSFIETIKEKGENPKTLVFADEDLINLNQKGSYNLTMEQVKLVHSGNNKKVISVLVFNDETNKFIKELLC